MLSYKVHYTNPASQIIHFELSIDAEKQKKLTLQLPAWRPGRYTLQNFAKNIHHFSVLDENGQEVPFRKSTKDKWIIEVALRKKVTIHYDYHASQMDAGGSWLDSQQIYINPITCCFQVEELSDAPYKIQLKTPQNYKIATSLPLKKGQFIAQNFHELVDSPILASADLQHKSYTVANCLFHLWILGDCQPDWKKMISQFKAFTKAQIEAFGGKFPTSEYHFIFQILPYRHYHGVEHKHSTVITLGPSESFHENDFQDNLLGVSSHELYHTWNVTRLRSSDLVPYRYEGENYTEAGFVLEGITTYYGDLMLKRSGIWDETQYLKELEILLKRHFHNIAHEKHSVAEASFDLWLDGYSHQEPKRMPSIYVKGAIAALILDLEIRHSTQNGKSLDDVMQIMWKNFGEHELGYTIADYAKAVEKVAGKKMKSYFRKYIFGTENPLPKLKKLLEQAGINVEQKPAKKLHERSLGFKTDANLKVNCIAPNSPSYKKLVLGDQILAVNQHKASNENLSLLFERKNSYSIHLFRNNLLLTETLNSTENQYFSDFSLNIDAKNNRKKNTFRKLWYC